MKFSALTLFTFLASANIVAAGASSSSSKGRKLTKAPSKPSKKAKKNFKDSTDLARELVQARATMENVDIDQATPAEIIFFEDALQDAIQTVLENGHGGDKLSVRSVLIQDEDDDDKKTTKKKKKGGDDRMLRGHDYASLPEDPNHRSLWYYSNYWGGFSSYNFRWFNVWASIEFYGCHFCDDDEDDIWNDDDDRYNWRRGLDEEDLTGDNSIAMELCNKLRDGPHERFHSVQNCNVEFIPSE